MADVKCTTFFGKVKPIPKEKMEFRPAAYAILIKDKKILLIRMKRTGKYFFPGGGIEKGEKLEDGLRREVMEETGLEIEIGKLFHFHESFFYYDPLDEAYHCLSFVYICTPKSLDIISDDKVNDYEAEMPRWIEIDKLKKEDFQSWGWEVIERLILKGKLYCDQSAGKNGFDSLA